MIWIIWYGSNGTNHMMWTIWYGSYESSWSNQAPGKAKASILTSATKLWKAPGQNRLWCCKPQGIRAKARYCCIILHYIILYYTTLWPLLAKLVSRCVAICDKGGSLFDSDMDPYADMDCCKGSIRVPNIVWIPVWILYPYMDLTCMDPIWILHRSLYGSNTDHIWKIRYGSYDLGQMIWNTWYDSCDMGKMVGIIWYGPYDMGHMKCIKRYIS